MDQLDQAIEFSSAFNHDGESYGVVPAHLDPFSFDHLYQISSMISYDQGGLPFWNPYLTSISGSDTLGLSFDPSGTLNRSADSTAIVDCAAGAGARQVAWSTGLGSYQLQAEQDFEPAIDPALVRPNCTDIDPRSIMQQSEAQLRQDKPHHVPDAPRSALSRRSHPEGQPQLLSKTDKKQIGQLAAGLKIRTGKKTIGGIKRGQPQDGNDDQPERRDSKRRGRAKTQHASTKPVLSPVDTLAASTSRPLNPSPSSGSLAESGTPSSPGLYKATSLLSIGDGSMASIRNSLERQGRTWLSKPDNNDDDAGSAESDVSPVSTGISQFGPFSRIPPSQEPIVTSTAFSTHQPYHSHGQPGRSSISSTSSSSLGSSQQEGGPQSSPTTSVSSSSLTAEPTKTTAQSHRHAPASKQRWRAPESDQKARNRVAATKCRLKTKAAIARLEVEERAASERNAALGGTLAGLREEALVLRSQLLMHSDCGCTLIQQYLANRARRLAASAGGGEGLSKRRDGREAKGHVRDEEPETDSEFVEEGPDGMMAEEDDEDLRGTEMERRIPS